MREGRQDRLSGARGHKWRLRGGCRKRGVESSDLITRLFEWEIKNSRPFAAERKAKVGPLCYAKLKEI